MKVARLPMINMGSDLGRALGEATDDIGFFFVLPIVAVGLVVTLVDLVAQLIALPLIVIARVLRLASWPVQLDRKDKYIRTLRTKGFGAAATLRDQAMQAVKDGTLPDVPALDPPRGQTPVAQTPPGQAPVDQVPPGQVPPTPAASAASDGARSGAAPNLS